MKKLFLVSFLLLGVSFAFGKAPIKISTTDETNERYATLTITSLYDGKLVIDFSQISINKGRCRLFDAAGHNFAQADKMLGLVFGIFDPKILEATKNAYEGEDFMDRRVLEFDYGDKVTAEIKCSGRAEILDVTIPTNVGTFTFK